MAADFDAAGLDMVSMERSLQAGSSDDGNVGEPRRAEKRNRNGKSNRFLECYGFAGDRGARVWFSCCEGNSHSSLSFVVGCCNAHFSG